MNQGRKKFEHMKKEAVLVEGEPGEKLGCLPSASDTVDPILIIEPQHLWWQYELKEEWVKGKGEWERERNWDSPPSLGVGLSKNGMLPNSFKLYEWSTPTDSSFPTTRLLCGMFYSITVLSICYKYLVCGNLELL